MDNFNTEKDSHMGQCKRMTFITMRLLHKTFEEDMKTQIMSELYYKYTIING